jgi:hypothetical protein
MKVIDGIEQGSLDWYLLRAGKVTASEMDRLVTPLGKIRTGDGPKTYLMEKLAERWIGGPLPSKEAAQGVWDLQQGHFLEEYARPAFTIETGLVSRRAAFVETDDGRAGCSPDGLIGDNSGLELKCPHIEKHLRYLLDGKLPADYVAQVQGSMYVTGFDHWYFASFRRNLPMFILRVEKDDEFQESLGDAMDSFLTDFEIHWQCLVNKNGGPPPPPKRFTPTPGDPKAEMFKGIPEDYRETSTLP